MKKPSEIKVVKAKKAHFLLPAFSAITLFGVIKCKSDKDIEKLNKTDGIDCDLESHETIHVRQAESMKDSWWRFYIEYIWEWICNIPLITVSLHSIYKFMPVEIEAYGYEDNYKYIENGPVYKWKDFKKLTIKQKREFAKEYNFIKKYRKEFYTFNSFIKKYIIPLYE